MIQVTFVNQTDETQECVVGPEVSPLPPGGNKVVEIQPSERVGFTKLEGKKNISSVVLSEFTDNSLLIYATPIGIG